MEIEEGKGLLSASNTSTYNKTDQSQLSETNTAQKHNWQYEEVLRLIVAYEDHKDEQHHPKKRKYLWTNIENDMISSGFNVSAEMCNQKWRNLLKSYKTAKDNKNSSGRGACRFMFFDVMDEVLGTTPSNQSTHTLSSLSNAVSQDVLNSPSTSSSSMTSDNIFSLTLNNNKEEDSDESINIKENTKPASENIKKNFKRKRNDDKIALKKEKLEIQKRKLAMEEEKIKLMKEYIALKKSDFSF